MPAGNPPRRTAAGLVLLLAVTAPAALPAQLATRTSDPLGLSLRFGRVKVLHQDCPGTPGTSCYLQQVDPWLAYAVGHSYFQREWTVAEGLFTALADRPDAAATNSCAMCHNLPFRTAGSGGNVADPGGFGRNVPHLFGVGLIETLGLEIRQQILLRHDRNHNGFLDVPAETRGQRAVVEATPGVTVDFGPLDDLNADGLPGLNDAVRVVLVDHDGKPVVRPDGTAPRLGDPEVAGYDLYVAPLAASVGDHQLPTLRSFALGVVQTVLGIPVLDTSSGNDSGSDGDRRAGDGWAETSNAGAWQRYFPVMTAAPPDGKYLREGELDLLEWYLLNHPAPGVGEQNRQTRRGRRLLVELGCTRCHVERWQIRPASPGFPGDRRFFDLDVHFDKATRRLVGVLTPLSRRLRQADGTERPEPRGDGYTVRGFYSDLRHHDLGDRFSEYFYRDGSLYVLRRFRTPPLWGVGSTAPYGHDGRSPTLDDVIRRHGGTAEESAGRYRRLSPRGQRAVIAFLESLVLYSPDMLPVDVDGDGRIATDFQVAGAAVGLERLRPEFLFRTPPRYRRLAGSDDPSFLSLELVNRDEILSSLTVEASTADTDGKP